MRRPPPPPNRGERQRTRPRGDASYLVSATGASFCGLPKTSFLREKLPKRRVGESPSAGRQTKSPAPVSSAPGAGDFDQPLFLLGNAEVGGAAAEHHSRRHGSALGHVGRDEVEGHELYPGGGV